MAWLRWLASDDAAQQALYVTYREYYDGIHNVPLTSRQEEYLGRDGIDWRFNYLALPVDVLGQRLNVIGFETDEDEQSAIFWDWWNASRMDEQQKHMHQAAQIDGDTYVLVEWDNDTGIPKIHHELAYDGEEGVKVHYRNRRGQIEFASKRWREVDNDGTPHRRMNIYAPDAIYKWEMASGASNEAGWMPLIREGEAWPEVWLPGVVPVTHARFKPDGSNWGKSQLDDLIPLQQALNKSVLDYLEGLDKTAYEVIFATGTKATDKDGNSIPIQAGTIIGIPDSDVNIIIKPAANIDALREAKREFITSIAQLSQIPLSQFQVTGQVAAADTQRGNESGLIALAEDAAVSLGNTWENVMKLARLINNAYGTRQMDVSVPISTQWDLFERIDQAEAEQQRAQTLATRAQTFTLLIDAGVDRAIAARHAGYDEGEAQEMAVNAARRLPGDEL
jgi:hypothetical protein